MQRLALTALAFGFLAMANASAMTGKPFEPEFSIVRVVGEVLAQKPGAARLTAAEVGESYPYGTLVETRRNASAVLRFSDGNECRISARTLVRVGEDTRNNLIKKLDLRTGKLEFEMKQLVPGEALHVETAAAICGTVGTIFSTEATREKDVNATLIVCKGGKIFVNGEYFEIDEVRENSELVVSVTDDRDYMRIRIIRGEMLIRVNTNAGLREIPVKDDSLIKIFAKKSADGKFLQITTLVYESSDEGANLTETLQFTIPVDELPGGPDSQQTKPGDPDSSSTTPGDGDDGDLPDPNLRERLGNTTTTTTTTTTTIPSVTPVGKR